MGIGVLVVYAAPLGLRGRSREDRIFGEFVHERRAKLEGRAGRLHDTLGELVGVVDGDIH